MQKYVLPVAVTMIGHKWRRQSIDRRWQYRRLRRRRRCSWPMNVQYFHFFSRQQGWFALAGNRRASIHAIDIRHQVFRPMASKQSLLLLWSISGEMIQDSRVSCNHIFITKSWQFVLSHINLKIMLLLIFLRSISWTQGKLRWKFWNENIVITYVSKSHDFVTKMWEVTLLWWKCDNYIWIESHT